MIGMKKGLFGKGMPGATMTGLGGGVFNMDGTPASMPQDATMRDSANLGTPSAAPQKSGFFGKGGVGRGIAGSIGDALLQQSGMAPIYAPQMQFQQVQAARQAEEQRRRAADLADYGAKKQIDQQYAGPAEAPAFIRNAEAFYQLSPEDQARVVSVQDIVNPMMRPGPDGQFYPIARPRPVAQSDWDNAAPIGPTQQSAPAAPAAPILGAQTIGRREYGEMLTRRFAGDQRAMNAWMAQNNILAGN